MEEQDSVPAGSYKIPLKDRKVLIEWIQFLVKKFPSDPKCPKFLKIITDLKAGPISLDDFFLLENSFGDIYNEIEKDNLADEAIFDLMDKVEPILSDEKYLF